MNSETQFLGHFACKSNTNRNICLSFKRQRGVSPRNLPKIQQHNEISLSHSEEKKQLVSKALVCLTQSCVSPPIFYYFQERLIMFGNKYLGHGESTGARKI